MASDALVKFDHEDALERGYLSDEERAAVLELLTETSSALEIAVRLDLPAKMVRKLLLDPDVIREFVLLNLNSQTMWFSTVALSKLRTLIGATKNPDVLLKAIKLMSQVLAFAERVGARPKNPVGRPRTQPVGVQVNIGYDKLVQSATEGEEPPIDAQVVGEDDGEEDDG